METEEREAYYIIVMFSPFHLDHPRPSNSFFRVTILRVVLRVKGVSLISLNCVILAAEYAALVWRASESMNTVVRMML